MADVDGPSDKEQEVQPKNRLTVLKSYLERGMLKVAPQMVKSIFESLAKVRSGPNGEFESLDGESVRCRYTARRPNNGIPPDQRFLSHRHPRATEPTPRDPPNAGWREGNRRTPP